MSGFNSDSRRDELQKRNAVILIPALDPPMTLEDYIKSLVSAGFDKLIIVNDGSSSQPYRDFFRNLNNMPQCHLLTHDVNLGKGRALKDGYKLFLDLYAEDPAVKGVITVDSDGQHTVRDVIRIDDCLGGLVQPELILGVRSFDKERVPAKSRHGNILTSRLFRLLFGRKVSDTQTGLRGIPKELLTEYLPIRGERFEFETNQLVESVRMEIPFHEVPIETVYIDSNKGTHFRPVRDSAAIYRLLFGSFIRFTLSSLTSSLVDLGLFQLVLVLAASLPQDRRIWAATVTARICSSLYNYYVNKTIVFRNHADHRVTFVRYYILCALQMICSAEGVTLLSRLLPVKEIVVKIIVDVFLFCISYQIQRRFVFVREKSKS